MGTYCGLCFDDPILDKLWLRLPERFTEKIRLNRECWEWTGSRKWKDKEDRAEHPELGYGQFWVDGKLYLTHRLTYLALHLSVPDNLPLDHYRYPDNGCIGPSCCNPRHLIPTSHRENILRSNSVSAKNVVKTHCPKGHEYTPENTYIKQGKSGPQRECRLCRQERMRKVQEKRSADRKAAGLTARGTERKLKLNPTTDRRFQQ